MTDIISTAVALGQTKLGQPNWEHGLSETFSSANLGQGGGVRTIEESGKSRGKRAKKGGYKDA